MLWMYLCHNWWLLWLSWVVNVYKPMFLFSSTGCSLATINNHLVKKSPGPCWLVAGAAADRKLDMFWGLHSLSLRPNCPDWVSLENFSDLRNSYITWQHITTNQPWVLAKFSNTNQWAVPLRGSSGRLLEHLHRGIISNLEWTRRRFHQLLEYDKLIPKHQQTTASEQKNWYPNKHQ